MRYYYQPKKQDSSRFSHIYVCNHPLYSRCTLYQFNNLGLAVIQQRFDADEKVTYWTEDGHHDEGDANITDEDLVINCVRDGEVPGIHAVMYDSDADMITIEHSAHSRKGFALGAVLAAEFTANHSGLLTTSDLFKF